MDDTIKYLIRADVTADGVVERSDVVGAVFGQTEGLLGEEMDLRSLQKASKVGRIDVDVESEQGQSFGQLTIETSLDKVATATLAAALETITRIGPCRASVSITAIQDVRAAKRRQVVERAKELLTEGFEDSMTTSDEILEAVREQVRVEDITEYEGLPAGPRVAEGNAVIVVEGRADVLTLLQYGVKNAVAVEGTNVPDPVADLTRERTTTVFLDGDRGGDLILEELTQVGDIDYVAFAPDDRSVEDLDRGDVYDALRNKVPYDAVAGMSEPREAVATDGSAAPAPAPGATSGSSDSGSTTGEETPAPPDPDVESATSTNAATGGTDGGSTVDPDAGSPAPEESVSAEDVSASPEPGVAGSDGVDDAGDGTADADGADVEAADRDDPTTDPAGDSDPDAGAETDPEADSGAKPDSLAGHVETVVGGDSGLVRLLDDQFGVVEEAPAGEAFDVLAGWDGDPPASVVLDDSLGQRLLDVAAQLGVRRVVARELGEFTKRPTGVRILTAEALAA